MLDACTSTSKVDQPRCPITAVGNSMVDKAKGSNMVDTRVDSSKILSKDRHGVTKGSNNTNSSSKVASKVMTKSSSWLSKCFLALSENWRDAALSCRGDFFLAWKLETGFKDLSIEEEKYWLSYCTYSG